MEISRTINSNKRYYLDETGIENSASFVETMRVFNDAKMSLYNALYDQKYLKTGPLLDDTYPMFLKGKYKTNDYYNAAIYTAASGQLSSQRELNKYYKTTITEDLKTRNANIRTLEKELENKKAIKKSIKIYQKGGQWITPYPRCQLKVKGRKIVLFNRSIVNLDEFERSIEANIRELKKHLALAMEARNRKAKKLENLKNLPPKRIVFGGKKLYSMKDNLNTPKALMEWRQIFFEKRHRSMSLPGRHTSKYGNFLCKYDGNDLVVTCIDGSTAVFHDFKLARYDDYFQKNFVCSPTERQSLCYNFNLKRDRDNRQYLIVSVTMELRSCDDYRYTDSYYSASAISMDIHYNHFSLVERDEKGNFLNQKLIHFNLVCKSIDQITNILGMAVKDVFDWCAKKNKHLIVKDIGSMMKLESKKYVGRKRRHYMTLYAYQRILSSIENQSLRREIAFRILEVVYTKQNYRY